MKLIVTVGISGSGKSTWARMMKDKNPTWRIVCPDLIRKELTGSISDQSRNADVWKEVYATLDYLNKTNASVILDSTCTSLSTVKSLLKKYHPIFFKLFDCDPDTASSRVNVDIINNIDRSAVPREVIQRQYEGYKFVKKYLIDNRKQILTNL